MKLNKKILIVLILSCYATLSTEFAYADNNDASDPIAQIANTGEQKSSNTTDSSNNSNTSNDNSSSNTNTNDAAKPLSKKSQDAITNMLLQSVSLMGIAYKWGGNTPTTGMDCSGFVRYVYQKSLGINLPRTAAEQAKVGKRIGIDDLEPGDLIFFNSRRGSNTHVGIYLGNNKFIQSPRTGENIQITDLNSGYWRKNFNGAKRIVQESPDDSGDNKIQSFQNVHDEALPVTRRASSKSGRSRARHSISSSRKNKSNNHQQTSSNNKKKTSKKKKKNN